MYSVYPGFVRALEEEADQSALELGPLALVERESGAGHFGAEVEVDQVKFLGDVPVWLGVAARRRGFPTAEDFDVVVRRLACRHEVARGVGQLNEELVHLVLRGLHGFLERVGLVFEACGLGLDAFCFFLLAFAHQPADLTGEGVALGEHLVEFGLGGPTLGIELEDLVDGGRRIDVALGQGRNHAVALLAQALKGQHVSGSVLSKNKNSRPVGAGSSQAFKWIAIRRLPRESRRQTNGCSPSCGIGLDRRSTRTRCGPCPCRRSRLGGVGCRADARECCQQCSADHQRFLHPTVCFGTHVRSSNSLPLFCVPWYRGLETLEVCVILLSFWALPSWLRASWPQASWLLASWRLASWLRPPSWERLQLSAQLPSWALPSLPRTS